MAQPSIMPTPIKISNINDQIDDESYFEDTNAY